jgi:oligoendopeptidase F
MNLPSWDNSKEYTSINSDDFRNDLEKLQKMLPDIKEKAQVFAPLLIKAPELSPSECENEIKIAQKIYQLEKEFGITLHDMFVFVHCELSRNARNKEALNYQEKLRVIMSELSAATNPLSLFLSTCQESVIEKYLDCDSTREQAFLLHHSREMRDFNLNLESENLLSALKLDGHDAWDKLYTKLSSTMQCTIEHNNETHKMGLAKASQYIENPDPQLRESAWKAIKNAWETHEETCAAALNALSGWRLNLFKAKSKKRELHFLDPSLHSNRMKKESLEALVSAIEKFRPRAQYALGLLARAMKKSSFAPWDLAAPAPALSDTAPTSPAFSRGFALVKQSAMSAHPEMGEFIQMMLDKSFIDAEETENRQPGAYCTSFIKTATPRVFTNYSGQLMSIRTLAHELGHAFHHWVMRDLPLSETHYPMTLAESASLFGEVLLSRELKNSAQNNTELFPIAWHDALMAVLYTLNIPLRFTFEREFYETRSQKELSADDFKELMTKHWNHWYGDAMSEPNNMFWASKMHFYLSRASFYNYPYFFGYTFAHGIYARSLKQQPDEFYRNYCALLRDSGRMKVEDLIHKHLDGNPQTEEFWSECLKVVDDKIAFFDELLNKTGF